MPVNINELQEGDCVRYYSHDEERWVVGYVVKEFPAPSWAGWEQEVWAYWPNHVGGGYHIGWVKPSKVERTP